MPVFLCERQESRRFRALLAAVALLALAALETLCGSNLSSDPAYHVATKTWELSVAEGSPGDAIVISAGLWNASQCQVVWTYTVE